MPAGNCELMKKRFQWLLECLAVILAMHRFEIFIWIAVYMGNKPPDIIVSQQNKDNQW